MNPKTLQLATVSLIILAAALARILPHAPNFTPIAAIALFGAVYAANRTLAFAVPLAAMFISDIGIGLQMGMENGFHSGMLVVYLTFIMIGGIGLLVRNNPNWITVTYATLASSILFFLTTNFSTWLLSDMYPHTREGLAACFTLALPYFRNTLMGDAFFVTLLFGGYALLRRGVPALKQA